MLRALGYEKRGIILRSRYVVPLLTCGDSNRSEQIDTCLIQCPSTIILLAVQEDKEVLNVHEREAQIIAEAIATFQYNNRIRTRSGESELDSMTIPCISMIGALPIFYLAPVTRELSEAVATSQCPLSSTVVQKCVVTSNNLRLSEGMETPDFRQVSLQHYAAFRTLAETHWS